MKTADLGPGILFPIYAAASKGINKSKHSKYAVLPWESTVSSCRELCRRGKVAGLLNLVLLPKVQVFDPLGISADVSLISLSSRKHLPGGIKAM